MRDEDKEAAREEAARREREQDRQDLWREEGGLPSGRLSRFIHNRDNDPRTPEGQAKKRADQAMTRAAEWAAQKVTIAGVEMTNGEAQAARRRILDDPDRYARWARERGLIKAGQETEFIRTTERLYELNEIRSENEGELPPELEREERALLDSAAGRASSAATAQAHKDYGVAQDKVLGQRESQDGTTADTAQRHRLYTALPAPGARELPTMKEILPTAPDVAAAFTAGKTATVPLDARSPLPSSGNPQVATVDRNLKATGLDI